MKSLYMVLINQHVDRVSLRFWKKAESGVGDQYHVLKGKKRKNSDITDTSSTDKYERETILQLSTQCFIH